MCGPEDPFSNCSHSSQGSHFKQRSFKNQFTRPPFEKKMEILASTASIFGQILALKPQIWKFSVHKTPLSEAKLSSQAPCFGNPGQTPLPEKKLSALPQRTMWAAVAPCHPTFSLISKCPLCVSRVYWVHSHQQNFV